MNHCQLADPAAAAAAFDARYRITAKRLAYWSLLDECDTAIHELYAVALTRPRRLHRLMLTPRLLAALVLGARRRHTHWRLRRACEPLLRRRDCDEIDTLLVAHARELQAASSVRASR